MVSYPEALETILNTVQRMDPEEKPLLQAVGQVLAEDIQAEYDLPCVDTAGPDGYAVRAEDIRGADRDHPVTLRIIGTVRAGQAPKKMVKPGTAIRIMTGSVVPEGADCVVQFEDTDEPGNKNGPNRLNPSRVKIFVGVPRGGNIREPGSNIQKGALVVPQGTVLGPTQVSVITQLGKVSVRVIRRPVIAILSSGDELLKPGSPLSPGKTHDCNTGAIASFVRHYGGIPKILGIARDNELSIASKVEKGLRADALISSGGVSKGDYDLFRLVLAKLGTLLFAKMNMGPGRSVAFGLVGEERPIPIFALAGPPVGCMVNFETLVRPALLKMLGHEEFAHPAIQAVAIDGVPGRKPMAFAKWTKVTKVDGTFHVSLEQEGKAMLAALGSANSLTLIPENTSIDALDTIEVLPLDWCR